MVNSPHLFTNPQGTMQFSGGILGQDWKKVAEQTLVREQKKIDTLKKTIDQRDIETKAFGELKNKLADLQKTVDALKGTDGAPFTQSVFESKTALLSPTQQAFGVHVTSEAAPGSYTITVQNTALAYKLRSDAQNSNTTALNLSGSLVFATSSDGTQNPLTIPINASDTLDIIANTINQTNSYLAASVLSVDSTHYYLNITDKQTGQTVYIANTSTAGVVTGLGLGTESGPNFTVKNQIQNSQLATFTIDGQTVTRSTNTINDVLPGVVFDLYAPSSGPTTMMIERDLTQVKESVKSFITAYNDVRDVINKNRQKNADGTPSVDAPLYHSDILNTVDMMLERLVNSTTVNAQGQLNSLFKVGITTSFNTLSKQNLETGKIFLNESMFDTTLLTHLDQIQNLLSFSWTSADSRLSPLLWPDSVQPFPGRLTLDLTVTDGALTDVTNNQGWSTQISGNTITFTSGAAKGLVLNYSGQVSLTGVQFNYQPGLFQQMSHVLDGWTTSDQGLLTQKNSQSMREQASSKKELTQIEERYKKKLQEQIQKYTKMETEYARIQEILKSVQQMQASWFSSK